MFLDELSFTVRAGRGGDGCVSFHREKYITRGGPDGGDGGDGGSVILRTTVHENTLYHLAGRPVFEASNGEPGTSKKCSGAKAGNLVLEVPVGTQVFDDERGNLLRDLDGEEEEFEVVRGGHGGRGNARFATATYRVPTRYEPGKEGEVRKLRLSLKLIADVGLIGLPNAGKSTLLSTLSRARPKVADYPFTTLEPSLGIVPCPGDVNLVMADIPGLIEGAHSGKGLGLQFLKHVERTAALLHLVDCSDLPDVEPVEAASTIRAELEAYSPELAARPCLLVATKVEDDAARERARALADAMGQPVRMISSATRGGLEGLLKALVPLARAARSSVD